MPRDGEQELPVRREEGRFLPSLFEEDWWSLSPWQWLRRMREDMDRLMSEMWAPSERAETRPAVWRPTMEVEETDKEWLLRFDLPGVEPQGIDVSCSHNSLTVRAETRREEERRERGYYRSERRYGRFERTVPLPQGASIDQIQASYRNGVLEIHVPKTEEARARVRHIPVEAPQPALAGAKGGEVPQPQSTQAAAGQPPQGGGGQQR
ncbi:MAG: Hsp20/alpha crystallin family protein [Armatimonadetes bacterium]|nr:Hsp20/alpha crystallin family protein [Armatimonadota bacterium]